MNRHSTVADPAVSIMTMDLIGQVLARSDNPTELGKYLSEEIRELTGARCVLLVRGSDTPDVGRRQIMTVHPERRRFWAESPEVFRCFASHLSDTESSIWHDSETGSPPEVIRKEGFETCIIIPLITGNSHVGALFALGMPDIIHLNSVISLLDTLSTIIALVLRNSSLYELQELIIETRTSEVQAAYKEIRSELDERKKIESVLQSTNAYLENLITYANVPIVVWDPTFMITRMNQAFENLVGKKADGRLNTSLIMLFPADLRQHAVRLFMTTQAGVRLNTVEIPVQHQDGSVRIVIWNSATIFSQDGTTPVATIAQGQDVTIRRKLERESEISLVQIQKNLAQLSILNDGIRNPLSLILTCAETTDDKAVTTLIEDQIQRIDEMVSQLDKRWIESEKV
ncbi:MAG: hypothetical protein CVV33_09655, partial [Methanomicrobiales archaeon HGW-Methanomicrobiales-4]